MVQLPPKICPRCGEEYVHTMQRCVACDVPLGSDAPAEEPVFEMPPVGYGGYVPFGIVCAVVTDLVARAVERRSLG